MTSGFSNHHALPRKVSPPKWGIPVSQNQQLTLSSVRYAAAKDGPAKREGECRPLIIVSRPHDRSLRALKYNAVLTQPHADAGSRIDAKAWG
jgi:hypothetical protein